MEFGLLCQGVSRSDDDQVFTFHHGLHLWLLSRCEEDAGYHRVSDGERVSLF